MTSETIVELGREALLTALVLSGPILLVAVVAGLVVSLLQAAVQVQDQSLTLVPKIAAVVFAVMYLLPWMLSRMTDYSTDLFTQIPLQF